MILLDENFPVDQRPILFRWRIQHRQIGKEVADLGTDDAVLIPLLHRLRGVTFFTQDNDFFEHRLCHSAYCLVWLDVKSDDCSLYVRKFLRHTQFRTQASRMGVVARAHSGGIDFWLPNRGLLRRAFWKGKI